MAKITGTIKEYNPAEAITEAQLQSNVEQLARATGWEAYHPWLSVHSAGGYPDLTMVNPDQKRVVWAELKREGGKLSKKQVYWIGLLKMAGFECYVWYPSDWLNGEVERILTGKEK